MNVLNGCLILMDFRCFGMVFVCFSLCMMCLSFMLVMCVEVVVVRQFRMLWCLISDVLMLYVLMFVIVSLKVVLFSDLFDMRVDMLVVCFRLNVRIC